MSNERPDALLKSALEKIVYFEARGESFANDLASARAEIEHLKADLTSASQREIELRSEMAEMEVKLHRVTSERNELSRMGSALRAERSTLIGHVLEAAAIHEAGRPETERAANPEEGLFDLASFISELRSEVLAVQRGEPSPKSAQALKEEKDLTQRFEFAEHPVPKNPSKAIAHHARRLRSEGRLSVSQEELFALSGPMPEVAEETLFGFSVRELSATDSAVRVRAADRLKALGHPATATVLANALHTEHDPKVQVALLSAFAANAAVSPDSVALVLPMLSSTVADVRVAALKSLLTLSPTEALPHLSAAMKDPDRAVRRRATLLALSIKKEDALVIGEAALRDVDADVRAVGIRVLSAAGGEKARELLQKALRDADPKVRKAAAQGISCVVGEDLSNVASMSDGALRREIRRIAHLPNRPAEIRSARTTAPIQTTTVELRPVQAGVTVVSVPAEKVEQKHSDALVNALMVEIRCSLRGRPLLELAQIAHVSEEAAADACEVLVARGQAVKRGRKFFAA